MSLEASEHIVVGWYEGPRASLRHLFELADDSSEQIDAYITLGRVLAAGNEHGEIVGHLQLVPTLAADTVELKSVAVLPDLQRRGIGRRLAARALAICREEGNRFVTVTTATADVANLRFYQRLGFRAATIERDAFTVEKGYPSLLEADGIPVRDAITFTLLLDSGAG